MMYRIVAHVLLITALAACGNPAADQRADRLASEIRTQELEHFVRTFAIGVPERAVAWAEEHAHTPTIGTMIERGQIGFEDDPMLRELVTLLFAEREYRHLFVYGTQLTPAGAAVTAALLGAEEHGLPPERYHAAEIQRHLDVLASAGDLSGVLDELQLSPEEEALLLGHLRDHAALDETLPEDSAAFALIATPSPTNPLPEFADAISSLSATMERVAESGPTLELLLADGYLRYARDMRFSNLHYVPEEQREARGWDIEDEAMQPQILRSLLGDSFRRGASEHGFAAEIATLPPPLEQYERLREGLATYMGYQRAGGWAPIPGSREWRVGNRGDAVPAIRARLAAEDYFGGPLDSEVFDRELSDAVKDYQSTHQLRETGTMTGESYYSMNLSVERRIAQIQLSMQKIRMSQAVESVDEDYIIVNIPDFHAELWDRDERIRRWRVVVGRERWRRLPGRDREIAGRTPVFSDSMLYVVFHPYWNVPNSIRVEEYDPLIEADENWLVDNHFELFIAPDGAEVLRQLPGPHNALGLVKFLFPNEHDVYMHDTPSRSLFSRPTRAFSHGCVRVEDPMELAHVLLQRDRGWTRRYTEQFIEEQLASGEEEWVTLRNPIPIHIEYVGVRGADDGRLHFLADPYAYDREPAEALEDAFRARHGLPPRPVEEEP